MYRNIGLMTSSKNNDLMLLDDYSFKLKLLNNFKGDSGGWSDKGSKIKTHLNTLYFVLGGDGYISHDEDMMLLKSGSMYLIPSGLDRRYGCKTKIEKTWALFEMRNFFGRDLFTGLDRVYCLGAWKNQFSKLFQAKSWSLETHLNFKHQVYKKLIDYRIIEFAIANMNQKEERYEDILFYIENHCNAALNLTKLSEIMGMSPQGLSRAFHRDMGQTLKSYINDRLNRVACEYLIHANLKVKEISVKMGFEDEYYFNRFFKKMNGIPPIAFRKTYR